MSKVFDHRSHTEWQQRPIPCRGYDCREDERIWLDFENGIINPDLEQVFSAPGLGNGMAG
jgi:hypothetical protein